MPQSLSNVLVHAIFSTKNRDPLIRPEIESELYPYLAAVLQTCDSQSLAIGGTTDHVHLLFALSRTRTIASIIEDLKTDSSKWIKKKGREYAHFYWQSGYGAFSIGQSNVVALKRYIANQKEHHRKTTFQTEYRKILKQYNQEYDERYVWD